MFADPKAEDEESEDEKGVKAKERVVRKVESIFKKPHRAAGKLTLSELKWGEKKWQARTSCSTRTNRQRERGRQRCQKGKRRGCG